MSMKLEERAQQVWPILTQAARNRQLLTYTQVAERIGMAPQGMGQILARIMWYCDQNGLPPLTVLVVQRETGKPGPGLTTTGDVDRDREAVFERNWDAQLPPAASDFAAAAAAATSRRADFS